MDFNIRRRVLKEALLLFLSNFIVVLALFPIFVEYRMRFGKKIK